MAGLALVGLTLVGCKSRTDAGAPPCPKVAVLADASHMTVFRDGPGRDLTDVQFEADLGRIRGECIYNRSSTNVKVDMKLVVSALRGPAPGESSPDGPGTDTAEPATPAPRTEEN